MRRLLADRDKANIVPPRPDGEPLDASGVPAMRGGP